MYYIVLMTSQKKLEKYIKHIVVKRNFWFLRTFTPSVSVHRDIHVSIIITYFLHNNIGANNLKKKKYPCAKATFLRQLCRILVRILYDATDDKYIYIYMPLINMVIACGEPARFYISFSIYNNNNNTKQNRIAGRLFRKFTRWTTPLLKTNTRYIHAE